jgi:hypothetical protein
MTLHLQGSIFKNSKPCPCSTYDGEVEGFKFWHDWCDNGEKASYRLNTVQIGQKFFTWFADSVDFASAATMIKSGDYSIWVNRPTNRLSRNFNPMRLPT